MRKFLFPRIHGLDHDLCIRSIILLYSGCVIDMSHVNCDGRCGLSFHSPLQYLKYIPDFNIIGQGTSLGHSEA